MDKRALYEHIMLNVAIEVKKALNEDSSSIYNISINPMERNICALALKYYKDYVQEHPIIAKNVGRTPEDYGELIDRVHDKVKL